MEKNYNIVVIDDDVRLLELLEDVLGDEGYTVTSFSSTERIIEFLEKIEPSLIISDVHVTPLNGILLLNLIKHHDTLSATPFIFLTGEARPATMVEALRSGVDDYLRKPVEFPQLIEKIKTILQHEVIAEPKTVLVVDRSAVVRKQTQKVFTDASFKVETAASITQAKDMLESSVPDVVISSVKFDHEEDGLAFCREFKHSHPEKLFVFLTAATSAEEVMEGIKAGADDYVEKSIQPVALKIKVKALLKKNYHGIVHTNASHVNTAHTIQTDLSEHSFVELLMLCESQKFNGCIKIKKGNIVSEVEFDNGLPKEIKMSGKTEDEAMDELLTWNSAIVTIEQKTIKL